MQTFKYLILYYIIVYKKNIKIQKKVNKMKIKNLVKKMTTFQLAQLVKLESNKVATVYLPNAWSMRESIYFAKAELKRRGF